jgi:GNAT superfamily N-acetyltransferase
MAELASLIGIRKAQAEDVQAIEALHRASVRELAVGYYAPTALERFLASGTLDRRLIEAGTYYLAEICDSLVGSGGWMPAEDCPGDTGRARIRSIFVHPDHARQGIGRRLVLHAEAEAARAGFGQLELDATLGGVPLYRHLGYREVRRCGYALSDGTTLPVILMEKTLAPSRSGTSGSPEVPPAAGTTVCGRDQSMTCWPPSMPSTWAVTKPSHIR